MKLIGAERPENMPKKRTATDHPLDRWIATLDHIDFGGAECWFPKERAVCNRPHLCTEDEIVLRRCLARPSAQDLSWVETELMETADWGDREPEDPPLENVRSWWLAPMETITTNSRFTLGKPRKRFRFCAETDVRFGDIDRWAWTAQALTDDLAVLWDWDDVEAPDQPEWFCQQPIGIVTSRGLVKSAALLLATRAKLQGGLPFFDTDGLLESRLAIVGIKPIHLYRLLLAADGRNFEAVMGMSDRKLAGFRAEGAAYGFEELSERVG